MSRDPCCSSDYVSTLSRYFVPNPSLGVRGAPADTPKELELLKVNQWADLDLNSTTDLDLDSRMTSPSEDASKPRDCLTLPSHSRVCRSLSHARPSSSSSESGSLAGSSVLFSHRYVSEHPTARLLSRAPPPAQSITGWAEPGQLTALMGGSGAGKTTLMDCVAGRKTVSGRAAGR